MKINFHDHLAYIVGVALGDGNLSCPNGRAIRLRITCDTKYPTLINEIESSLRYLFPENKVSHVPGPRSSYMNISVYSNKLAEYIPWAVGKGSKEEQGSRVPNWIHADEHYSKLCLKGLLQTDGSVYKDRGYTMVNFTNTNEILADDVMRMIERIGYQPRKYRALQKTGTYKYTIRLAKEVEQFIDQIKITKS